MIIDIHAHTSNKKMHGLHMENADIDALKELSTAHLIEKTVLMATYFPFKGGGLSNLELLRRVGDDPQFCVFGSLNLMENAWKGLVELESLAERGLIAGVKLYPGYQNFDPTGPVAFLVYELAARHRLPVAIHTGELHHCCPREDRQSGHPKCGQICWIDRLGDLARPKNFRDAAKIFSKTNFILCHLGNPYFEEARSLMRDFENVYTDISGQFLSGTEEANPEYKKIIVEEIQKFLFIPGGINRVMFGTDFPIQSYADSVELVESLGLIATEKEKIYRRNALKTIPALNQRRGGH